MAALLLCCAQVHAATVGLVVDERSKQAVLFHEKLQQLSRDQSIQLYVSSELKVNMKVPRWLVMGPKSLKALLDKGYGNASSQVLALFIPAQYVAKFRQKYPSQTFSILDNSPTLERQLALIKVLKPQAKNVVLFHGEQYTETLKAQQLSLSPLIKKLDLKLSMAVLKDPLNWDRNALKALKAADLVLGVPDRAIYNATTIRSILMRLYRAGKALIGPDKGYVKAGAVASIYSSITDTLDSSAELLKSKTPWPSHIPNPNYSIKVNGQVARSLNLSIADGKQLEAQVKELLP